MGGQASTLRYSAAEEKEEEQEEKNKTRKFTSAGDVARMEED